jgi:hypothetical protein
MSPSVSRFAAALLLSVSALHAEETAPAKTDAPPPYQLKKRSEFSGGDANSRAPFWPIGWVKRTASTSVSQPQQVPVAPRVQLDSKSFKVTSILLGAGTTPSFAVINGRAYSEGEFLRMPKGSATPAARVRVQRITDGSVVLQNADQTLVAALIRPELSERRPEELLLDPDR